MTSRLSTHEVFEGVVFRGRGGVPSTGGADVIPDCYQSGSPVSRRRFDWARSFVFHNPLSDPAKSTEVLSREEPVAPAAAFLVPLVSAHHHLYKLLSVECYPEREDVLEGSH